MHSRASNVDLQRYSENKILEEFGNHSERDEPRFIRFSSPDEAVDTHGEVAGFFLPQLDSRSGPTEKFSTIGVQQTSAALRAQTAAKELE